MKSDIKKPWVFPKKPKNVVVIGVCGAAGSFSEEAAKVYIRKHHLQKAELRYLVTAEAVLFALSQGEVALAIFPVENSIGGIVRESLFAGAKYTYAIQDVFSINIHQNILVKKGISKREVTHIVSHEQALKQCSLYLRKTWPKITPRAYPDTAQAAHDVAEGILPSGTAVVASKGAARHYNLTVLAASVEDQADNRTTFVVATAL